MDFCDDLTQLVYQKLNENDARRLRDFQPRHPGSAYGFLRVVASNVVHNYFKAYPPPSDPIPPDSVAPAADIEKALRYREIDDFLRHEAREIDRVVFWLYYRQGLTAKEIAALPRIDLTTKGVESVMVRLGRTIRSELNSEGKCLAKTVLRDDE